MTSSATAAATARNPQSQRDGSDHAMGNSAAVSLPQDQLLWYTEREELQTHIRSLEEERTTLKRELANTRVELRTATLSMKSATGSTTTSTSASTSQAPRNNSKTTNGNASSRNANANAVSARVKELQAELASQKSKELDIRKQLIEARETAASCRQRLDVTQQDLEHAQEDLARQRRGSENDDHDDDQVSILQDQRSDLSKKVQQLLEINGKLRSTSAHLRLQLEQRDDAILHLEASSKELHEDKNVGELLLERQLIEYKNYTSELEAKIQRLKRDRDTPKPKQSPSTPSRSSHSQRLVQQVEELQVERERLLHRQHAQEENWGHEKNLLKKNVKSLEVKVHELEQESLHSGSGRQEFLVLQPPPSTIVHSSTESVDEHLSMDRSIRTSTASNPTSPPREFSTRSRGMSITPPREFSIRSRGTSVAVTPQELLDRVQKAEDQLVQKEAKEAELTAQVNALSFSAKKAQRQAERSKEQVELLQTYLDVSLNSMPSKEKALQETILQSVASLEKKQDQHEREREQAEHLQQRLAEEKLRLSVRQKARMERVKGFEQVFHAESKRVSVSLEESYNASSRLSEVQELEAFAAAADRDIQPRVGENTGTRESAAAVEKSSEQQTPGSDARLAEIARKRSKLQEVKDERDANDDDPSVSMLPADATSPTPRKTLFSVGADEAAAMVDTSMLEAELSQAKKDVDRLQEELKESRAKLDEATEAGKTETKKLKQKFRKASDKAEVAQMELDTANAWVSDLRFQIKEQAETQKEEVDELKKNVEQLTLSSKMQKKALDAAKQKVTTLQDAADEQEEELEDLQKELEALKQAQTANTNSNGHEDSLGEILHASDVATLHGGQNSLGEMLYATDVATLQGGQESVRSLADPVSEEKETLADELAAVAAEAQDAKMQLGDSIEVQKLLRQELKASRAEIVQLKEAKESIEQEKSSALRTKQIIEKLHQTEMAGLIQTIKESDFAQAQLDTELAKSRLEVESYRARVTKLEKKVQDSDEALSQIQASNDAEVGEENTFPDESVNGGMTEYLPDQLQPPGLAIKDFDVTSDARNQGEEVPKLVSRQMSTQLLKQSSSDSESAETESAQVVGSETLSKEIFTGDVSVSSKSQESTLEDRPAVVSQAPKFAAEYFTGGSSVASDSESSSSKMKGAPIVQQVPKFSTDFFKGGESSSSDSSSSEESNSGPVTRQTPKFSPGFFMGAASLSSSSSSSSSSPSSSSSSGSSSSAGSWTAPDIEEMTKHTAADVERHSKNSQDATGDGQGHWDLPLYTVVATTKHFNENGEVETPFMNSFVEEASFNWEDEARTLRSTQEELLSKRTHEELQSFLRDDDYDMFEDTITSLLAELQLKEGLILELTSQLGCHQAQVKNLPGSRAVIESNEKFDSSHDEETHQMVIDQRFLLDDFASTVSTELGSAEQSHAGKEWAQEQDVLMASDELVIQEDMSEMKSIVATQQQRLESASNQLSALEGEIMSLSDERLGYEETTKRQLGRLESARDQLNHMEAQIAILENDKGDLEDEKDILASRIHQYEDKLTEASKQIQQMSETILDLQTQLQKSKSSRLDQPKSGEDIHIRLAELEACESQAQAEAQRMKQELDAVLAQADEKYWQNEDRIARYRNDLDEARAEMDKLKSSISQSEADVKEANRVKSLVMEDLDAAMDEIKRLKQEKEELQSRDTSRYIADSDAQVSELDSLGSQTEAESQKSKKELEDENNHLMSMVEKFRVQVSELESLDSHALVENQKSQQELEEENKYLKSKVETYVARLENAALQLNEIEELVQASQSERDEALEERDQLQVQVESQRKHLEGASKQLNDMEDALLACEEELETCELHNKALEARVHTMKLDRLNVPGVQNSSTGEQSGVSRSVLHCDDTESIDSISIQLPLFHSQQSTREELEATAASRDKNLLQSGEIVLALSKVKCGEEDGNDSVNFRIDELEKTIGLLESTKEGLGIQIETVEDILYSKLGDLKSTREDIESYINRLENSHHE